jgi:hypothetical protein
MGRLTRVPSGVPASCAAARQSVPNDIGALSPDKQTISVHCPRTSPVCRCAATPHSPVQPPRTRAGDSPPSPSRPGLPHADPRTNSWPEPESLARSEAECRAARSGSGTRHVVDWPPLLLACREYRMVSCGTGNTREFHRLAHKAQFPGLSMPSSGFPRGQPTSLALASRFRLMFCSAAYNTSLLCSSGGIRTRNLPLYPLSARAVGGVSPTAAMSTKASATKARMPARAAMLFGELRNRSSET